jgi:Putative prokaryotic signal transducing protein
VAEQIPIRTFATRPQAEVAQGLLAAAGIASWLATDDAGGAYPFEFSGGARVMVDESDREAALKVLASVG